jgi:hypothetical protein
MVNDGTRNTNTKGFLRKVGMTKHGATGQRGKGISRQARDDGMEQARDDGMEQGRDDGILNFVEVFYSSATKIV